MEGSKTFSKDFMSRHSIPTAAYRNFTDHAAALAYVSSVDHPIVIKASGLAAGKGVIIPTTKEEAIAGLNDIMVTKEFGAAGEEVVVEEFLTGQELSILAFSDGYTALALPGAQDHKRIGDGDTGPNTGGMGTYSPAPCATKEVEEEIMKTIVQPTIDGMRRDGTSDHLMADLDQRLIYTFTFTHRHPFRRYAFHRRHAHADGTQGARIQRALRRPRDPVPHGASLARD
jgi:phosphoribosylamine--glycine ligase/phosphoribosylformylglycinamidine cyclo-ligase